MFSVSSFQKTCATPWCCGGFSNPLLHLMYKFFPHTSNDQIIFSFIDYYQKTNWSLWCSGLYSYSNRTPSTASKPEFMDIWFHVSRLLQEITSTSQNTSTSVEWVVLCLVYWEVYKLHTPCYEPLLSFLYLLWLLKTVAPMTYVLSSAAQNNSLPDIRMKVFKWPDSYAVLFFWYLAKRGIPRLYVHFAGCSNYHSSELWGI